MIWGDGLSWYMILSWFVSMVVILMIYIWEWFSFKRFISNLIGYLLSFRDIRGFLIIFY